LVRRVDYPTTMCPLEVIIDIHVQYGCYYEIMHNRDGSQGLIHGKGRKIRPLGPILCF
jgi:hypothetical protein